MPVDFIGVGGQRCATTWLYNILNEHPEIKMSTEKELHFFSYYYHFGYEWYDQHFDSSLKIRSGEFSTSYLYDNQSPLRVHKYNKNIKILVSIRNPISRLFSHHKHEILGRRVLRTNVNPKLLIDQNPSYLEYGLYFKYLSYWLKVFPSKQIHIVLFDEIKKNPKKVVSKLYEFLGVDESFTPLGLNNKINKSWTPKNDFIHKNQKRIAALSRTYGLGLLIDGLKIMGIKGAIDKANKNENHDKLEMDKEFLEYANAYFNKDIEKMSNLLGLDLNKIWVK